MKTTTDRNCKECGYDGRGEFGPFHGNRCPKCGNYSRKSDLFNNGNVRRSGGKNKLFKTH